MDERVVFNRVDAERIARAVRKSEAGDRDEAPLGFRRIVESGGRSSPLRLGTFQGNWSTGSLKTVTLHGVTSTPNTARVLNLTMPIVGVDALQTHFVIFGRVRHTTDLLAVEIQQPDDCLRLGGDDVSQIAGFVADQQQILGHDGTCLKWYDITTCGTAAT